MICKCTKKIPQGRVDLGFKTCVGCSTVEQYGCINITYNKTGNTIQITSKEVADKINRLASRSGYGIMRGMKG